MDASQQAVCWLVGDLRPLPAAPCIFLSTFRKFVFRISSFGGIISLSIASLCACLFLRLPPPRPHHPLVTVPLRHPGAARHLCHNEENGFLAGTKVLIFPCVTIVCSPGPCQSSARCISFKCFGDAICICVPLLCTPAVNLEITGLECLCLFADQI